MSPSPLNTNAKAKPAHEVRLGSIKAAVWANQTTSGLRYNATLSRLYKDGDDQWKSSDSFGRDDLLVVAKVADLAHSWISRQSLDERAGEETPTEKKETKPKR